MTAFFKPFRRKLGVVMLLIACVLAAAWIRSRTHSDWIVLFGNTVVISGHQKVFVLKRSQAAGITIESTTRSVAANDGPRAITSRRIQTAFTFQYSLSDHFGWGFATPNGVITAFGVHTSNTEPVREMFPYWLIVLPLTFLSSYLLLSRPRASAKVPT